MLAIATASPVAGQTEDEATSAGTTRSTGHATHNLRNYLDHLHETDSLTEHWFGLGDKLTDLGITSTLNLWMTYQANVTGGLSTGDDFNGQYWWGNHFDFERMVGLPGASAFLQVEGGWNRGINDDVGALMDVNGMIAEDPIGVTIMWYQQNLLDERLRFRLGKIDVTTESFEFHGHPVAFDAMPFANTPRTQFLDTGLVNNAAVPFPAAGLAAMMLVEPVDRWYIAAAGYDRNEDRFGTNWSRTFDDWMISVETGVIVSFGDALEGLYYAGYWYSTFPESPDGQGVYLGAAQQVYRESDADDQGVGLFAWYGYSDRSSTGIDHFWSFGVQYRGLFPKRDRDVLALGWAQAFTTGGVFTAPYEGALELYYRARITPWFHLSPHFQYIVNPGSNDIADAITLGLRGQITF